VGDAMLHMMTEEPHVRREWGAQARRRVVRDYDLETQTDRLMGILRELTG
jgi:hypothetical protein